MPGKIGFTVLSCTGEDERYRAADLNYHGPTVKGWRSSQHCSYPQDLTLQLLLPSVITKIQILVHQYLIPHKIEIWVCEELEFDPSISPSALQCFQYLGFITLSDNQATGFKSRELKSVTTPPTPARYLKLRLYENHHNERNVYNQVGLVAVSVLGDNVPTTESYGDNLNNNDFNTDANLICNPQYTSPYDDLAFEMYVDRDVARIMRLMERKKHQAVLAERFEYARKLKNALDKLRVAGETLGRYDQEKRQAINLEDYDKAKSKKNQIDKYRDDVYNTLCVEQLLELDQPFQDNDRSGSSDVTKRQIKEAPKQSYYDDEDEESHESQDLDTSPPHSHYSALEAASEHHVTWSPRHPQSMNQSNNILRQHRRTSLTDYPTSRSCGPSPNPLTHSYSHSAFPTSSSSQQLYHDVAQFQCYTPYPCHPAIKQPPSLEQMYQSLPPLRLQEQFYVSSEVDSKVAEHIEVGVSRNAMDLRSPPIDNYENRSRANSMRSTSRQRSKSTVPTTQSSFEAYEERMLPALRHPQLPLTDVVRECQLAVDQVKKSKLNEREKKLAALPITVFSIELVEKFYSKHFADKEDGLHSLQEDLKKFMSSLEMDQSIIKPSMSPNKMARATIFLLHRALRDKVYSVYSAAADAIRFFFHEFVSASRVSPAETARSVEKLLPELIAKSGDVTPRVHNLAAHTLLSMVDCKQVRELHIIPAHLSRPLSSSVHPRLALSRLEMVEQLILNHGISTDKQSGLTCRTLAEFGSSGLHHPAEAVRKVSERVLLQVYKVNPRLVRKQLPPDDDVTRRNLLYRQIFQEFDLIDIQKRREQEGQDSKLITSTAKTSSLPIPTKDLWNSVAKESSLGLANVKSTKKMVENYQPVSQIPKRTVNQMTSPIQPNQPFDVTEKVSSDNRVKTITASKHVKQNTNIIVKSNGQTGGAHDSLLRRRNMTRISEEDGAQEDEPIKHFTNLVDSVHIAETRRVEQNTLKKTVEYIFPTTYIGNAHKNDTNSSMTSLKRNGATVLDRPKPKASGIPIPRNGFKGKRRMATSLVTQKTLKPVFVADSGPNILNNDMLMSVYIPNDNRKPVELLKGQEAGDTSSSPSIVTPPSDGETANLTKDVQNAKACIFCLTKENWMSDESLNMHYWKSCPMLTQCCKCSEVVEISGLILHKLDDCEFKKSFVKCDKCQEAILREDLDSHYCSVSGSKSPKTRCSFCHDDLMSVGEWREHLMGSKLCKKHPRHVKQ